MRKGTRVVMTRLDSLNLPAWRRLTSDELDAWRNSNESKGMTDSGETKLPPRAIMNRTSGPFTVVKGRVIPPPLSWNDPPRNCAELVDSDGVTWYARNKDIRAAGGNNHVSNDVWREAVRGGSSVCVVVNNKVCWAYRRGPEIVVSTQGIGEYEELTIEDFSPAMFATDITVTMHDGSEITSCIIGRRYGELEIILKTKGAA